MSGLVERHGATSPPEAARWPTRRELVLNAAGLLVPIFAAVLALPVLTTNLGLPGFGALSLLLALFTYVGVLDFGFSAAVAYRASMLVARGQTRDIPDTVRTAAAVVLVLGAGVAAVVAALAAPFVAAFASGSAPLQVQLTAGIRVLACVMPIIFLGALLTSVQLAHCDFSRLNYVRISVGLATVVLTAVATFWTQDLQVLAAIIALVRVAGALVQATLVSRLVPALFRTPVLCSLDVLRPMLHFGGWITVSNLIGPVMTYMDRFYLGFERSLVEVAEYVSPYELATRISLLPAAVLPALFPRMVAAAASGAGCADDDFLARIAGLVALGCALPAAALACFSPEILRAWMGDVLPSTSAVALQVLAAGVLVNCVAQVFFQRVQAAGDTKRIACTHLAELGAYLLLLWLTTAAYGVVGVALAWTLRVLIDAAVFCHHAARLLPAAHARACWRIYAVTLVYALALMCTAMVASFWVRALFLLPPLLLASAKHRELIDVFRSRT
ncbi:MAG: oligosaccharide flippase family protein [Pseudomonadota bacterium]